MLIDVHCHLDLVEKEIDLGKVFRDFKKNNVGLAITNGLNSITNIRALELAHEFKEVKCALGIYPIEALKLEDKEIDKEIDFIRKNKAHLTCIGEVGMDFKEDKEEARQERNFEKFIHLSKELNVPITVHSRKAEEKCISVLERLGAKKVIMHYFSGSLKLVDRIVNNHWYLSIPTCVTYNEHFQNVIKTVAIEHLLCETDSPYSHPERKFPNTPANVLASYEKIAEIKGLSLKEVEKKVEENFKRLFG